MVFSFGASYPPYRCRHGICIWFWLAFPHTVHFAGSHTNQLPQKHRSILWNTWFLNEKNGGDGRAFLDNYTDFLFLINYLLQYRDMSNHDNCIEKRIWEYQYATGVRWPLRGLADRKNPLETPSAAYRYSCLLCKSHLDERSANTYLSLPVSLGLRVVEQPLNRWSNAFRRLPMKSSKRQVP